MVGLYRILLKHQRDTATVNVVVFVPLDVVRISGSLTNLPIIIALVLLFIADNVYSNIYPNTGKGITDYGDAKETG